jgi:hypothetical protein
MSAISVNCIKLCENLFHRKTRNCATMMTNRGIPHLQKEAKNIMKEKSLLKFEKGSGSSARLVQLTS